MTSTQASINLFKGKKRSFLDKFFKWALTFGRFVVIITETIALLAFLYRFSLDRELIDLHDTIKQKQAIVKLFKDNENKYRNFQERIALSSKLVEIGEETATIFNDIVGLTPSDVVISNFILLENQIKIDANIQSIAGLTKFIQTLKTYPKISSVSLDKIENKATSATIVVGITATIKKRNTEIK